MEYTPETKRGVSPYTSNQYPTHPVKPRKMDSVPDTPTR